MPRGRRGDRIPWTEGHSCGTLGSGAALVPDGDDRARLPVEKLSRNERVRGIDLDRLDRRRAHLLEKLVEEVRIWIVAHGRRRALSAKLGHALPVDPQLSTLAGAAPLEVHAATVRVYAGHAGEHRLEIERIQRVDLLSRDEVPHASRAALVDLLERSRHAHRSALHL